MSHRTKDSRNISGFTKSKRKKLIIRFDEEERKNFLTGFQKRKNERRKAILQKKDEKICEERKQVKMERKAKVKDAMKKYGLLEDEEEDSKDEPSNSNPGDEKNELSKQGALKNKVESFKETKSHTIVVSTIPQLERTANWMELITSTSGELDL